MVALIMVLTDEKSRIWGPVGPSDELEVDPATLVKASVNGSPGATGACIVDSRPLHGVDMTCNPPRGVLSRPDLRAQRGLRKEYNDGKSSNSGDTLIRQVVVHMSRRIGTTLWACNASTTASTNVVFLAVQERARVDQHLALVDAGEDRRLCAAEPQRQARRPRCDSGRTATSRVGRFCVGSEPLPICEKPSIVVTTAAEVSFADRLRRSARPGRRSRPGCGGASAAWALRAGPAASSRNSDSVASRAASVSLPTRTIRANGFLRIGLDQVGPAEDDAALAGADELVGAGR